MSHLEQTARTFTIKKLGNLEEGKIQVKPLTLLCGPNNTGKTWCMYSIYGFLNNQEVEGLHGVDQLISELKENGVVNFDIQEWLDKNFKTTVAAIEKSNKARLPRTFSANSELFEHSDFSWEVKKECLQENLTRSQFNFGLSLGSKGSHAFSAKKEADTSIIVMTLLRDVPRDVLKNSICSLIYKQLLGKNGGEQTAFLIPAERNGLHLFYRELSSRRTALLHHASRDELDLHLLLKDVLGSKYAQPIADYIDWLNELTSIKKGVKKGKYHDLAEDVKKLVDGRYHVDADGNITYTPKKKRGGPTPPKMDLHLSSSTVKSLFGLWFYLEYQAEEHSVLMIDEPELNLHPSNQRAVARLIAKIVNAGLNIVISTHSDYFLRELNSLIMLGTSGKNDTVKQELLSKYSIDEKSLLNKETVAAYVFDCGSLKAMEIGDEGIIATTFDEQINTLNDSSDDIYYSYVLGEES
ncbi:AAA family ATPase [Vibrio aestuarianus]|uniref:AAA_15 domain-containing protein n=3 Tax=Vibrio aestuarianus TaxID=28171 RepID=A0ABN8TLH7_9VIBR|nr:AAA family ATPase [Vibrio aestuarianus]MDE1215286.1 ATP-binding protein [Vibrio aestuarianus]MDE1218498.1 ATP-binding protein [Vibrio aestuarianus]MDE1259034.1 ATP-binding protein [Vibrio aestuarianus]MDE1262376.1 ATP-binding protein [Vibrio aestuarianus]MDE1269463.1 ATP-binding protein [Vibrio aestuarianus]